MDSELNFYNFSGINFASSMYENYPLETVYFNDGLHNYLVWSRGKEFTYLRYIDNFFNHDATYKASTSFTDPNYISRFIVTNLLKDRGTYTSLGGGTHEETEEYFFIPDHIVTFLPLNAEESSAVDVDYTDYSNMDTWHIGKGLKRPAVSSTNPERWVNNYGFYRLKNSLKIFLNEDCSNMFRAYSEYSRSISIDMTGDSALYYEHNYEKGFFFPNTYSLNTDINATFFKDLNTTSFKHPSYAEKIAHSHNSQLNKIIERNLYFPYGDEYYDDFKSDPNYISIPHFDFRYVKNMDYMFTGLTNFQGNLSGYAASGDNVNSMNWTYAGTAISFPKCGANVTAMQHTYDCCNKLTQYVMGPSVEFMESTYANTRMMSYYETTWEKDGDKYIKHITKIDSNPTAACSDVAKVMYSTYYNSEVVYPVCGASIISMYNTYANCNYLSHAVCGENVTDMTFTYRNSYIGSGKAIAGPNVINMPYAYFNATINETPNTDEIEKVINIHHTYARQNHLQEYHHATYYTYLLTEKNYLMLDELQALNFYTGAKIIKPYPDFYVTFPYISDTPTLTLNVNWENDSSYDKHITSLLINDHPSAFDMDYAFTKRDSVTTLSLKHKFQKAQNLEGAFYRCSNIIESINSYNTVYLFRTYAYCNHLKNAFLGENSADMRYTFYWCNNLENVANVPFGTREASAWINVQDPDRGWELWSNISRSMYKTYSRCNHVLEAYPADAAYFNNTYEKCNNLIISACHDWVKEFCWTYTHCPNLITSSCGNEVINMIGTFYNCDNLIDANCGPNVLLMDKTYYDCNNLIKAECSDSVINMCHTYANCNSLENAVCGQNVLYMAQTYENCKILNKAICGPKVTSMDYTYANCIKLETAVSGPSVLSMHYTYSNDYALTAAACSDSVKYMINTYEGCSSLKSAICGSGVIDMNGTYYNCDALIDAVCGSNVINMNNTYSLCNSLEDAVCGDKVKEMDNTYFSCDNLKRVACGKSVLYMNNTYKNCPNLIKAECSDSVFYMNNTYERCTSLETAVCGANVLSLEGTYKYCTNLITAACGPKVERINDAYADLLFLTKAECSDSVVFMENAYRNCPNLIDAKVGKNVKYMNYTYENCDNLKTTIIGSNVQFMIGAYASCPNITDAYIGPNVANMYQAYYNCANLINIHINWNDRTLSDMNYAFAECPKLNYPIVPRNVYYTTGTFEHCVNLTGHNHYNQIITYDIATKEIEYNNTEFYADSIVINSYGANNMYNGCIKLPGSAYTSNYEYSKSYNMFRNCQSINKAFIKTKYINDYCFADCHNLQYFGNQFYRQVGTISAILPSSDIVYCDTDEYKLEYNIKDNKRKIYYNYSTSFDNIEVFGNYCFLNCGKLSLPTVMRMNVERICLGSFEGCNIINLTLVYKSSEYHGWQDINLMNSACFKNCKNLTDVNFYRYKDDPDYTLSNFSYGNLESLFEGCEKLKSENIKGLSLTSDIFTSYSPTLNNTFRNCKSFTIAPILPKSVSSRYGYMNNTYYGCDSITEINLSYMNNISCYYYLNNTFRNCNNLTKVILNQSYAEYNYIVGYTKHYDSWSAIHSFDNCFRDCVNLTSISTSGKYIMKGNYIFSGSGLSSVYAYCSGIGCYSNCKNLIYLIDDSYSIGYLKSMSYPSSTNLCDDKVSHKYIAYEYQGCSNAIGSYNSFTTAIGRYENCSKLIGINTSRLSSTSISYISVNTLSKGNAGYDYQVVGQEADKWNQINCFKDCYSLTGSYKLSFRTEDWTNCFQNCIDIESLYFDSIVQTQKLEYHDGQYWKDKDFKERNYSNMFTRPLGSNRLNIIFNNQNIYNYFQEHSVDIMGCQLGDSSISVSGLITLNYKNDTRDIIGTEDVSVVRGCNNIEHNVFMFCTE